MSVSLKIEKYSHGCRVTGFDVDALHKTTRFLETLSLKEPQRVQNRMQMVLKKKYYGMTENRRELFIHRNTLTDYVNHMSESGYPTAKIVYNQIPVPEAANADYLIDEKYQLRDYQIPIVTELADDTYSRRLDLQTGKGKAQPLDALIKVPGGWKRMGDIQLGDTVTAYDGSPTKVIGVYPQGEKEIFKITFADGRSTECCAEHLWKVYYVNTVPHQRWRIVNTVEMLRLINMPNPRVYVPLADAEDKEDHKFPLDPYVLGALLGDGHIGKMQLMLSSSDTFIVEEVRKHLPDSLQLKYVSGYDYRILKKDAGVRHEWLQIFRELELDGLTSLYKRVPQSYLLDGSRAQRLALLQGLMDTDGTVQKSGSVSFTSSSYELAWAVQYLVRSLGGIAAIRPRNVTYTYKGLKRSGAVAFDVDIRHKKPSELFRIPRKVELTNDNNQYSADLKLRVVSIEAVGVKEAQCISIDHPERLYVTDEFVVTHNTFTTLAALARMAVRGIVMIPPKYFGIWKTALEETYSDSAKYRMCSGSGELKQLIIDGLDGNIHEEVVIVSCVSYRGYIEAYETYGENIEASGYMVPPPRFHEAIGAGCQINDEFQEDPGLYFRIDVYSNVKKMIYLSATPYTGNPYVTRMIDVMTPAETRCTLPEWDRYIDVVWIYYSDPTVQAKDYLTPFKNTYNHARYETKMLEKKKRLDCYQAYVRRAVEGLFVRDMQPGQKALILCSTVKFIHALTKYLQKEFPDLSIGFHVAGCDYKKLVTYDIIVSTPKSCGTGVDIPNLRETFLLVATGSEKDAVQIMGRTRPLKLYPNHTPRLNVLVCNNIPQHGRYMAANEEVFAKKARFQRKARL